MANHKSAKKRARQSVKKNERNRSYLSMVKRVVKNFRVGLEDLQKGQGDAAKVGQLLSAAQAALHKAATKGLLHRNNASRRVSRLNKQLQSAVNAPKA